MIVETTRALVRLMKTIEPNTHMAAGNIVELASLPSIVLKGPSLRTVKGLGKDSDRITVIDVATLKAVREVAPRWYDMLFTVAISAESTLDALVLQESLSRLNQTNPLLTATSATRERKYAWYWDEVPSLTGGADISGVVQLNATISVQDVEVYSDIKDLLPLITWIEADMGTEEISSTVLLARAEILNLPEPEPEPDPEPPLAG